MPNLTKEQRDALPGEHFAVPNKRKLPIHDATHVRLAWDMVDRTQDLTQAERGAARTRILRRAKSLGIDTSGWESKLNHGAEVTLQLTAMSIELPHVDGHPNRMPFSGVLTRIDRASDKHVGGAGGKKTYLSRAVAEKALPSLLSMPIDFTANLDGHDVKKKIGTITDAEIFTDAINGDGIFIKGFFYAADFPQECARIQDEKEDLGFSYEIRAQTQPMNADTLQIVDGTFTGAAVLYKDKAAYQSTSLAAKADEEIDMNPEELKKLLLDTVAPISAQIATLSGEVTKLKAGSEAIATDLKASKEMREKVAPHATALRNCAAGMEAAGIGLDSNRGHVRALHHMAASMEAEAASGKLPHIYRDHDYSLSHRADTDAPAALDAKALTAALETALKPIQDKLSAAETQLTDLKKKAFDTTPAPERKTLSAEGLTLLAKAGIKPDDKGKVTVAVIDAAAEKGGLDRNQSMTLKLALKEAGALEAA